MKNIFKSIIVTILLINFGCSKDEEETTPPPPPPPVGYVSGVITSEANAMLLQNVNVSLFKANNNQVVGSKVTDATGTYKFSASPGSYYLKVSAQGYENIPPRGLSAVSFTIINAQTLTNDVEMTTNQLTNTGYIVGRISYSATSHLLGSMVVASDGINGYSTISDKNGYFIIYNVPAGVYDVKGWVAGSSSNQLSATVVTNTASDSVFLSAVKGVNGSVTGSITFLSTSNLDIDVALTHPLTEETVPGLSTKTSGGSFSISNVADGQYLARASYANDGIVMDPDWIVKNGEPYVTVSGGAATRDFSVTGAIELISPTNISLTTLPLEISSTTPTFEWKSYSSTSDYVIEVSDSKGNVIWGGFSSDWTVKNISIPSSQTSVVYNSDGNASANLEVGKVYRWRIYASKDAQGGASWNLISSSEDQMGLIKIVQ